jgi:hypothetical protein
MSVTYENDFYSWTKAQADALKRRSANELDWDLLSQELEALGKTEIRELKSRYRILLLHLLKWIVQPDQRSRSWENTIQTQRDEVCDHLSENPGLRAVEAEAFATAYRNARRDASSETDLDIGVFPKDPPFTMDQAKDENWWPA